MAHTATRLKHFCRTTQLSTIASRSSPFRTAVSSALCGPLHNGLSVFCHQYSSVHQPANARPSQLLDTLVLKIQDPGPNPQKVAIILEELHLPFTVSIMERVLQQPSNAEDVQVSAAPSVEDKNTGMIIIEDSNRDVLLWESLAIVEYLIQTYDTTEKLHYTQGTQNWWMCQQWLAYQMGAQSPFFSLKAWFSNKHQHKVPSVVERFSDDVFRIASIMEHYLVKGGTGFLVGDKCTYADLVFVPWSNKIEEVMGVAEASSIFRKYPHYRDWHERLLERPAVQRIMQHNDISTQ